jgi:predicted ATPase/class 3 adenylate cyclase
MGAVAAASGAPGGLGAYVPRVQVQWLRTAEDERWRRLDATLVFVDVSGFTALSERLARSGRIGAEELTETIGSCFDTLLEVAYRADGSLLKFGGDALLLLFSGEGHTERGCRAAVGMRQALRDLGKLQTSAGPVSLQMSIGVHSGEIHLFLVGTSHRELVVTGPGATETVTMEAAADAGQIVISPSTRAVLDPAVVGEACGPGYLLVAAPSGADPGLVLVDKELDPTALERALPLALRQHLTSTGRDAEHRRVTVAFLKFRGIDALLASEGEAAVGAALDAMVTGVQSAADAHGVTFLGTDIDAGGGKVILVTGAPASGGNDEERMLLALRDIVEQPVRLGVQIGVHAGHVFAGDIGPAYRRAYTVMGDAVNLAARVMGRSLPRSILATDDVLTSSRTAFQSDPLDPFAVKGKSEPVLASRVGEVLGARSDAGVAGLPFVGREEELAAFDAAMEQARDGTGCLIDVIGDAGIGKSRLMAAFRERTTDRPIVELVCELHRASVPYGTTRKLLRTVAGIASDAPAADAAEELLALMRRELPDMLEWAPLLAIAFGTELPETEATATLDERFLRPRLHEVVTRFLDWAWDGPTLLTMEDAQWMDEASTDTLRAVATRLGERPWVWCLTRRERDADPAPEIPRVTMALAPLDPAATAALADAATEAAPLAAHDMAQLVERCGGNPLFLQELVSAARDLGSVDSLPDSIGTLVTARIDRLPTASRSVLREVSVLGYSFPRGLAAAVLTSGDLSDLAQLAEFLVDEGEIVRFQHALIRDAAYEGLRYRLRRDLHAKAADVIATAAEPNQQQMALLSFHYFHAGRSDQTWRTSLTAAEGARAVYANADAATFLERAVESARGLEGLSPTELARAYEALGDVRELMGTYREAAEAYRTARRLLPPDPVAEGRLLLKQARGHGWLSRYSQARRWIRRGLKLVEELEGPEAATQRADLSVWYAQFCEEEGRYELALRWCHRAIAEAEAAGAREVLAHAYRLLDRAYVDLGRIEDAKHSAAALALYEELGDLRGQSVVTNNLAGLAYYLGDWATAREQTRRSLEVCRQIGDQDGVAAATLNLGKLLCDQGRLDEAAELLTSALRMGQAAGHRVRIAIGQRDLARVAARSGRTDDALELLASAHEAFVDVGAEADDIDTLAVIAECHLLRGDPERALAVVDEALQQDHALGGISGQSPLLHRLRGFALWSRGATSEARHAFEESLAAGRSRDADYEVALTLDGLASLVTGLAEDPDAGEVAGWCAESRAILERLEVVQVPAFAAPSPAAPSRA